MKLMEYEYIGCIEYVITEGQMIMVDKNEVKYIQVQLDNNDKTIVLLTYHNLINALKIGEGKIVNITYESINNSEIYLCKSIRDLTIKDECIGII